MSRSYKKTPGYSANNTEMKKKHNRALRRDVNVRLSQELEDDGLSSGKSYRKKHDPYNIKDCKSLYFVRSDFNHLKGKENEEREIHKLCSK